MCSTNGNAATHQLNLHDTLVYQSLSFTFTTDFDLENAFSLEHLYCNDCKANIPSM